MEGLRFELYSVTQEVAGLGRSLHLSGFYFLQLKNRRGHCHMLSKAASTFDILGLAVG